MPPRTYRVINNTKIKAWSQANESIVHDAKGNLFDPLLAHQQNLADAAKAQAAKAVEAARTAAKEAKLVATGELEVREKTAQGVVDAYKRELDAAGDLAEKKLAVTKGWRTREIAAEKELLRVKAQQEIDAANASLKAALYNDDGSKKLHDPKKEAQLKAQNAQTIASINSKLKGDLAAVTVTFDKGMTDLGKTARNATQGLANDTAQAAVSAAKTAADTRYHEAERGYLNDLQLAGTSKEKIFAVEQKWSQKLRALKDAEALADKKAAEQAENVRYQAARNKYTDAGKAVPKSVETEHTTNMAGIASAYKTALADNARNVKDLMKRASQDAAGEQARITQEQNAIAQQGLENRLKKGLITQEEFQKQSVALTVKGLQAEQTARLVGVQKGSAEEARIKQEFAGKIEAAQISGVQDAQRRVLEIQAQNGQISLKELENQLQAGQITWEKYEKERLAGELANIETTRQQNLMGVVKGSADWIRINREADAQVSAAKIASSKATAQKQADTAAAIDEVAMANLQNRFEKGEISRRQLAEDTLKFTLNRITRQRDADLRNTELTEGQRTAIKDKAEAEATAARVQWEKGAAALTLQIQKEGLDDEAAAAQDAREAGHMDAITFNEKMLDITQRRLENERDSALAANQDGADGVTRIWAKYDRERGAAARKAAQERQQIEIDLERQGLNQQAVKLQNGYNSGEVGVQDFEQGQYDIGKKQLELDWKEALSKNTEGLNGQVRLWQAYQGKLTALSIDFAAKQRERARGVTEANADNAKAALTNQLNEGLIAQGDYDKSVLALDEDRLNRAYDYEAKWGHKTAEELLALWNKLQLDKDALHADFLKKQRQRELDMALRKEDVLGKQNANAMASGDMDYTEFNQAERDRQGRINLLNLKKDLADAGGDVDAQGLAAQNYVAAEDAADIDQKKRAAQRAADFRKGQLQLDLDALETRVTKGEVSAEYAAQERLRINKEMLAAQEKADLEAATGDSEKQNQIKAATIAKSKQLDAEYQAWLKKREEDAQKELLSVKLSGLEAQYQAGLMSTAEYLTQREDLEKKAAYATYLAEFRAAEGNKDLQDAALLRYQQAVAASAKKVTDTQAAEARARFKEQNDLELANLESLHDRKLIGEVEYLNQKAELDKAALRNQWEAELAAAKPEEKAGINARYGQAIQAITDKTTHSINELHKANTEAAAGAFQSANNWAAMRNQMKELDKQISVTTDAATIQSLEFQKAALKIQMYGEMAKTAVGLFFEGMKAFGGMGDDVADQWAEDMGRMVDDAVSMAMEVGKALVTGDWVGAIVKGLQIVFGWFTRNKKAAEDAAKATKEYNTQFKFSKDGYGTRTVEKYTTGMLFWQTDHYKETVDEASKNLALGFEGAVVSGIESGMNEAAQTGSGTALEKSITDSLKSAALKGLTDAFLNSAEVAALFGPLVQKLTAAFKSGDKGQIEAAIGEFKKGLSDLRPQLDALAQAGKMVNDELSSGGSSELLTALGEQGKELEIQYKKGLISTKAYNAQIYDMTLKRIEEERRVELATAGDNAKAIKDINDKYDLERADAVKQMGEQVVQDRLKETQDVLDLQQQAADNAYQKGAMSEKEYQALKLKLALDRLDAEQQAELAAAGLTADEKARISQKYALQREKLTLDFNADNMAYTATQIGDMMRKAIRSGIESGVKSGLKNAITSGSTEGLGRAIRESVGSNVLDALIDTFMKSTAMKAIIEPAMEQLAAAIASPDGADDTAAYAAFDKALATYSSKAEEFAGRMSKTFGQGGLLGPGATDGTITNVSKDPTATSSGSVAYQLTSSSSGGFTADNLATLTTAINGLTDTMTRFASRLLDLLGDKSQPDKPEVLPEALFNTAKMMFGQGRAADNLGSETEMLSALKDAQTLQRRGDESVIPPNGLFEAAKTLFSQKTAPQGAAASGDDLMGGAGLASIANSMLESAQMQVTAAKMQLQAARLQMQASGGQFVGRAEAIRKQFGQQIYEL